MAASSSRDVIDLDDWAENPPVAGSSEAPLDLDAQESPCDTPATELEELTAIARALRGECQAVQLEPGKPATWKCSRNHVFDLPADWVRAHGFWCPRWVCLRRTAEAPPAAATLWQRDAAVLLRNAQECGCTVRGADAGGDATAQAAADAAAAAAAAAGSLSMRHEWRCREGCEFEQSLERGAAIAGWCPVCAKHQMDEIRRLSALAAVSGGTCVRLEDPQPRWHRSLGTRVRMQCALGHEFVGQIAQFDRDAWCGVCIAEQRRECAADDQRDDEDWHAVPAQRAAAAQRQGGSSPFAGGGSSPQGAQDGAFGAPKPRMQPPVMAPAARQPPAGARMQPPPRPRPPPSPGNKAKGKATGKRVSGGMTDEEALLHQKRLFEDAAFAQQQQQQQRRRRQQQQQQQQQQQRGFGQESLPDGTWQGPLPGGLPWSSQSLVPPHPAHAPLAPLPRLLDIDSAAAVEHVLSFGHAPHYCLGLPASASAEDIRKQYKQLALRMHPDKSEHPKAREAFNAIHKAYDAIYKAPPAPS